MRRMFFYALLIFFPIAGGAQDISKLLVDLDSAFSKGEYENGKQLASRIYADKTKIKNDTLLVEFLNTIGSIHYHLREYEPASRFFSEGAEKAKTILGENEYHYALAIFNLAGCYKEMGRFAEAEPLYLKSLPVLAPAFGQSSLEYTRCFYTLASMYVDMSRFAEAESMVAAAVNFYKTILGETSDDYLGALGTMGVIYQGLSRYEKAEEIFLSLKKYYAGLASGSQSSAYQTSAYQSSAYQLSLQTLENNLGELYRHMGEYEKARPYLLNAVKMAGEGLAAAYSLNNLALVEKALGNYAEAEAAYKRSIGIYQALGKTNHPDYSNPLNNLGELYRTMGRLQDAVYAFEEVIALRKQTLGEAHPNYANALNNLALVEFAIGMYSQAEKHLLECRDIYKKILGEKDKFYANSLNNLASVYKAQDKLKEAEDTYKETLRIYKNNYGDSSDKYAIYLGGLAGTYRRMKRFDEAIKLTLQSLAILKARLGIHHYDYIETKYQLAETYREAGRYDETKVHYMESMEGYLFLINKYFPYLSEQDKTLFYYNVSTAFETFNSFVFQMTRKFPAADHSSLFSRVYDNQVALKSLLLKESGIMRKMIAAKKDPALDADYKNLLQLKKQLVQQYRMDAEELEAGGITPAVLEQQINQLEQKLTIALKIRREDNKLPESWVNVKEVLGNNEAAVEIVRVNYYEKGRWTDTVIYMAMLVTKGSRSPSCVELMDEKDAESTAIGNYRKAMRTKQADDFSYRIFWEPLQKHLTGISRIYLSADGIYQQLNLYTLKNPASGNYLLNEIDLRLVTNSSDILSRRSRSYVNSAEIFSFPDYGSRSNTNIPAGSRLAGFPELIDLPGTKTEFDSIKQILERQQWKVKGYLQKNASEEEIKSVQAPRVLHIATHGYFLKNLNDNQEKTMGIRSDVIKQNPLLRSGLLLAGAGLTLNDSAINEMTDDGILTAYEAADLDLVETELVVLSACETGLGELMNSQGVYGLQRSFMVAGANAVMMSLWKIDDNATQELMTGFYREWLSDPGNGKQNALRKAQLKLSEKYKHPYYWGAFVLIGN